MLTAAIYVSNHGYGHASRVCALAEALGNWGIFCHLITDRPAFLFRTLAPQLHCLHPRKVDFGVIHQDNLQVDLEATKSALLRIMNSRNRIMATEVDFIRQHHVDFIISDASYLAAEIALYAKIPCYLVSNFDWYYVYAGLFAKDRSMRPVLNTIRGLYQLMDMAFRLPFSTKASMSSCLKVIKTGVLARRLQDQPDLSTALNIPSASKILLVMFGGEGAMELDYEKLSENFPGIVISTRQGVKASNHRCVAVDADFTALIKLADIILCKPGYSTFAEATQASKLIIYCKRRDYPEEIALVEGLKHYPHACELPSLKLPARAWKKLFATLKPVTGHSTRFSNKNTEIAALLVKTYLDQQHSQAKLLSIFDVGTNNLNYALFDVATDRALHQAHLTTGLGKDFAEGLLSKSSIERTIRVSQPLFELDSHLASQKVILATGISRMAKNAEDFIHALQKAGKTVPMLLPYPSEIRYGYHAAVAWGTSKGTNLAVDVGGATTEFIFFAAGTKYEGLSLNLGLLRLHEDYQSTPQATAYIRERLKELPAKNLSRIIGIGLTYYYLALVVYQLQNPWENEVNGLILPKESLLKLHAQIRSGEEESYLPYLISPDYKDILDLSVAYTISLLDRFQHSEILVCTDGISVGYGHWLYHQKSLKDKQKKKISPELN